MLEVTPAFIGGRVNNSGLLFLVFFFGKKLKEVSRCWGGEAKERAMFAGTTIVMIHMHKHVYVKSFLILNPTQKYK